MKDRPISYWHGVLGEDAQLKEHADTIKKILISEYQSAGVEIKSNGLYTARVNIRDRLVFITVMIDGKPYLRLLDVILNHDYQKSAYFKSNGFKRAFNEYTEHDYKNIITNTAPGMSFLPCDPNDTTSDSSENNNGLERAYYYNNQLVVLNNTQKKACSAYKPLVITGGPGSGKSCVALAQLLESENGSKVIYVTKSPALARKMQEIWNELPHDEHSPRVTFTTYSALARELNPDLLHKKEVGEREFTTWLNTWNKKHAKPIEQIIKKIKKNSRLAYTEFRNISNCRRLEDYLKLGTKQSSFTEIEDRKIIWKMYKTYRQHLINEKQFDASFEPLPLAEDKRYDFVVVDEAQDFSFCQLEALNQLAAMKECYINGDTIATRQSCFCMDTHQTLLYDARPKIEFIKNDLSARHIALPISYRCPEIVRKAAAAVMNLQYKLTGGKSEKDEQTDIEPTSQDQAENRGTLRWHDALTPELISEISHEAAVNANCAIIIGLESLREKAKELFGENALILTVEEAKGHEFDTVFAWGLFDNAIFTAASDIAFKNQFTADPPEKISRPKANHDGERFFEPFNAAYTIITRVRKKLIIAQTVTHRRDGIIYPLKNAIFDSNCSPSESSEPEMVTESKLEDWVARIKGLLGNKNLEQAKTLWFAHCAEELGDFDTFRKSLSDEEDDRGKEEAIVSPETTNQEIIETTPTPLDPKEYIAVLLNQFDNASLEKLFNHPELGSMLFNVDMGKGQSLIERICSNKKNGKVFTKFIEKNVTQCGKLTAIVLSKTQTLQNNVSAFHILINHVKCHPVLYRLCYAYNETKIKFDVKTPSSVLNMVIKEISQKHVSKKVKSSAGLFSLALYDDGVNLIKHIFEIYPPLIRQITPDMLFTLYSINQGEYPNISLFYLLAEAPSGMEVLDAILENNPEFMVNITGEFLSLARTHHAKELENISSLYHLCLTLKGHAVFERLLNENKNLVYQITPEALCRTLGKASVEYENFSPLYCLSEVPSGRRILYRILNKNQALVNGITMKDLTKSLTIEAGDEENKTPFWCLTRTEIGLKILNLLLDRNESLAKQITIHMLTLTLTHGASNNSPLSSLSNSKEGIDILNKILDQHPALISHICKYRLLNALVPDSNPPNTLRENLQSVPLLKEKFDALAKNEGTTTAASKNKKRRKKNKAAPSTEGFFSKPPQPASPSPASPLKTPD